MQFLIFGIHPHPKKKIGTNELIYKTETESQMQKDNIGGGSVLMVERLGVN